MASQILFVFAAVVACSGWAFAAPPRTAPPSFSVKFETTAGDIVVNFTRAFSPHGVDRVFQLVTLQNGSYYNENAFFRIVPNFVAQFGINGDPTVSQEWETKFIPDDPVVLSNLKGTVAFASSGPNTRTTQLYINYADNSFLDKQGFSPLGSISEGFDVALKLNAQYGEQPDQNSIYMQGNAYLKQHFPNLSYITSTRIVDMVYA